MILKPNIITGTISHAAVLYKKFKVSLVSIVTEFFRTLREHRTRIMYCYTTVGVTYIFHFISDIFKTLNSDHPVPILYKYMKYSYIHNAEVIIELKSVLNG